MGAKNNQPCPTTLTVLNVAELRNQKPGSEYDSVVSSGATTVNDGGGGLWIWDATSTDTDDFGLTVKYAGFTTGRWKRLYSGNINAAWFNAIFSQTGSYGSPDCSSALQAAVDAAFTARSAIVEMPRGIGRIGASTVTVPAGVKLKGQGNGYFLSDPTAVTFLYNDTGLDSLVTYNSGSSFEDFAISHAAGGNPITLSATVRSIANNLVRRVTCAAANAANAGLLLKARDGFGIYFPSIEDVTALGVTGGGRAIDLDATSMGFVVSPVFLGGRCLNATVLVQLKGVSGAMMFGTALDAAVDGGNGRYIKLVNASVGGLQTGSCMFYPRVETYAADTLFECESLTGANSFYAKGDGLTLASYMIDAGSNNEWYGLNGAGADFPMNRFANPIDLTSRQQLSNGMGIHARTATASPVTQLATDAIIAVNVAAASVVNMVAPVAAFNPRITICDASGNALVNNITINAPAGQTINGAASITIITNYGSRSLQYISSNKWITV